MLKEAEIISFVSNLILSLSGNVTCSLLGLHTVLAMHGAASRSDVVEQDGLLSWLPLKKSTKTLPELQVSLAGFIHHSGAPLVEAIVHCP